MRDDARAVQTYEPPSIDERTPIDVPLIGGLSGIVGTPSAAFRPVPPQPYVPPRIVARDRLDVPLIGTPGSAADSSAVFRTDQIAEE